MSRNERHLNFGSTIGSEDKEMAGHGFFLEECFCTRNKSKNSFVPVRAVPRKKDIL